MKLLSFLAKQLIIVLLTATLLAGPAGAADVNDYTIQTFTAVYNLDRDSQNVSTLQVEETIVAEFPDYDQNHGIIRAIPDKYDGHDVSLNVISVKDQTGQNINYSTSSQNDNLVLKIGDANRYVHGEQTYVIGYSLKNVTKNFSDHDEFYWDINGDQWMQTAQNVQVQINIAKDIADKLQQDTASCYTGIVGSNGSDCATNVSSSNGQVSAATTRPMGSNETLTLAIGFTKDTFAPYKMPTEQIVAIVAAVVGLGILPPALALFIAIRNWRKYGRDPQGKGSIVPEYLPPKNESVITSDIVLKEKFIPAAISAQIIDLAVHHYVKIYETKEKRVFKDKVSYELELTQLPKDLARDEKQVIDLVFGTNAKVGEKIKISELSNTLYKKAQEFGKHAVDRATQAQYFRSNPTKAKIPYYVVGGILACLGFVFVPFTLGLMAAGVILLIAASTMPARAQKGVELREYLLGLKMYMQLAEAERIKVMQSPHGKLTEKIDVDDKKQLVKLYEKLLPYAMLLGIERDWAAEFADMYKEEPDWYHGTGTFQAVVFVNSLHAFNTASTASFAPPSNSSSSGAGGGGFAGGGGGGGGGGGW
ncbi:MAG: DUF2207 domain-containing protein [Candidatus Woesebacteria bacterium]|jgi:uncharacterized membrane protein